MSLLLIKGEYLLCRKDNFPWFEALELDGSERTEQINDVVVLGCRFLMSYFG